MSNYKNLTPEVMENFLLQKDIEIDVLKSDINNILDTITPLAHEINNTNKFFKWFKYIRLVAILIEEIIKLFAKHKS